MSMEDVDERLSLYLDGELGPEERQAVENELAESEELQDRLERLKRASQELQNFYSDSQMIHAPNETDEDIVVERIVRESTMQARRSAIDRMNRRRPSFILMTTIGITIIAALFLGVRTWLNGEPKATDLLQGAKADLTSDYLEAYVKIPYLASALNAVRGVLNEELPNARFRLRTGPGNVFNVMVEDLDREEVFMQLGFDGKRGYVWRRGEKEVNLLSLDEIKSHTYVNYVFEALGEVRSSLDLGNQHPEALDLVGKVKDAAAASGQLWKVRLAGPTTEGRAKYWFDNDGKLRRVEAAGIQFDLNLKADIGPKDFEIKNVLPGIAIKEDL